MKTERLLGLDAARGFAMLAVCLSHFGLGLGERAPAVTSVLLKVGMVASPTFMLVSGMLLGYLVTGAGIDEQRLRLRLYDRGLFLLLAAHIVIGIAHYHRVHTWAEAARLTFMTDTIGAALIIGTLVLKATSPRQRLVLAGGLYVMSWVLVLAWMPAGAPLRLVKESLVGSTDRFALIRQNFPLFPWLAVYFAATTLGEDLAVRLRQGSVEPLARRMMLMGSAGVVGALSIKSSYWLLRPTAWPDAEAMPPVWRVVWELTRPFHKYPPGPSYLLAYGGLGLLLGGWALMASERRWLPKLLASAAVVGRASLMVFMVQFFIYYLLVPLIPMPNSLVMAICLASTLGFLWIVAWAWDSVGGNRFLVCGLRALADRADRTAVAQTAGRV